MKVAVLGSSGGMGSFFVRYFLARGETVRGYDVRAGREGRPKGAGRFSFHRSNAEAAKGSDLTVIASPMDMTLEVAGEVAGALKEGSTLMEMTSVKGETLAALRKTVGDRVTLLSTHPLFGPSLESKRGMKIAVITRGEGSAEVALAEKLFPDARIIPMTSKEHDKAMAAVLSLTHLLNIVYASTVSEYLAPEEFMRASTPNSSMQLTLAEAVLAQDPRLSYSIQVGNSYSRRVARTAARELRRVSAMIEKSDWAAFEGYVSRLSRRYMTSERASAAMAEIYSAAEKAGRD